MQVGALEMVFATFTFSVILNIYEYNKKDIPDIPLASSDKSAKMITQEHRTGVAKWEEGLNLLHFLPLKGL